MLLCNISIAQHIAVHLPEQALLRRHDTPLERRLVRTHHPFVAFSSCYFIEYIRRAGGSSWL